MTTQMKLEEFTYTQVRIDEFTGEEDGSLYVQRQGGMIP